MHIKGQNKICAWLVHDPSSLLPPILPSFLPTHLSYILWVYTGRKHPDTGGWVKRKQPLNLVPNRVTSLAQMRLTLRVWHLADTRQCSDGPYKQFLPVDLSIQSPEMNSLPAVNSFQQVRQDAILPEADSGGADTTTYPLLPSREKQTQGFLGGNSKPDESTPESTHLTERDGTTRGHCRMQTPYDPPHLGVGRCPGTQEMFERRCSENPEEPPPQHTHCEVLLRHQQYPHCFKIEQYFLSFYEVHRNSREIIDKDLLGASGSLESHL